MSLTIILDMDGTIIAPAGIKHLFLDKDNNVHTYDFQPHFNVALIEALRETKLPIILLSNNYDEMVCYIAEKLENTYQLIVEPYGLSDRLCTYARNIHDKIYPPRIVIRKDLIHEVAKIRKLQLSNCIVIDDRKENINSIKDAAHNTVHIDINWIHTPQNTEYYTQKLNSCV